MREIADKLSKLLHGFIIKNRMISSEYARSDTPPLTKELENEICSFLKEEFEPFPYRKKQELMCLQTAQNIGKRSGQRFRRVFEDRVSMWYKLNEDGIITANEDPEGKTYTAVFNRNTDLFDKVWEIESKQCRKFFVNEFRSGFGGLSETPIDKAANENFIRTVVLMELPE